MNPEIKNLTRRPSDGNDELSLRLGGKLPIIQIAGQPFFVDIRHDYLRPKDDLTTMGISFASLDPYEDDMEGIYRFPYDTATHSLHNLDLNTITAIPEGILFVEIPFMLTLDPVAYVEKYEHIDMEELLKSYPLVMERTANIIPWGQTHIPEIITQNKQRISATTVVKHDHKKIESVKHPRKKGRGL